MTPALEQLAIAAAETGRPSIKAIAAGSGIRFGMAMKWTQLSDPTLPGFIADKCNHIVAESDMKWNHLQPSQGTFDFSRGDALQTFASQRGMTMRGHALVWHKSVPIWLTNNLNSEIWESILESHIAAVGPHFDVTSWDVVNEVIATDASGYRTTDSIWYGAAGPAYIQAAYELARQYCPVGTGLAYCDFGTEHNGETNASKRALIIDMLEGLAGLGLIDSFCAQAHLNLAATFSEATWRTWIRDIKSLGLKFNITELDCNNTALSVPNENLDYHMSELVRRLVTVWAEENGGDELLVWGVKDDLSYLQDGATLTQRPLPWDAAYKSKMMERAIRRALS